MSDETGTVARPDAAADAAQARAVQQLNDEIGGIRKQFKALWVAVGVIGTITLILAILTILPRFGVRTGGLGMPNRPNFTNGPQFNGTGTQQQVTPGQ